MRDVGGSPDPPRLPTPPAVPDPFRSPACVRRPRPGCGRSGSRGGERAGAPSHVRPPTQCCEPSPWRVPRQSPPPTQLRRLRRRPLSTQPFIHQSGKRLILESDALDRVSVLRGYMLQQTRAKHRWRSREWTRPYSFKWILSVGDAYRSVSLPSRVLFRVPSRRFRMGARNEEDGGEVRFSSEGRRSSLLPEGGVVGWRDNASSWTGP